MYRPGVILVLLALALAACQNEVFPDAPLVAPPRQVSVVSPAASPAPGASADPGASPMPSASGLDPWVLPCNGRYMEFAVGQSNGKTFFAVYPLDASQRGYSSVVGTGTLKLTDSSLVVQTKPLAIKLSSESFLYAFPDLVTGKSYQVDITMTIGGFAYVGHVTYPHP